MALALPSSHARVTGAAESSLVQSTALITRVSDFWLLGGASVLVWLVMVSFAGFREAWAVDQHFKNLTVTTASLSLLVNYPHFLASYRLAYSRGGSFLLTHWWQTLAVPIVLIVTFAWAFWQYEVPFSETSIASLTNRLEGWGANQLVVSGPRLGDVLFGLTFNVMIFTVGWHYTKQVFGCTMVYAYFDRYPLSKRQRLTIKWSLLSLWWLNFAHGNRQGAQQEFSQFKYYSLDLPDAAVPLAAGILAFGIAATLYEVVWSNYKTHRKLPSLNMAVPFVALYVWWLPITRQFEFYFLLTPFFHSLQYLAFVYKMEITRLQGLDHPESRGAIVAFVLVLTGWLAFELLPNQIDTALGTFSSWQMFFFFTAATLFINIHHYFLDNVLWRFKDPHVRKNLLGETVVAAR